MIENMSWCWAWTRIPGLVFWIRQKLYPPSHPNQPLKWGSVLCYLWGYNISPSLKFEFGRLICAPRRSILNSARQLLGYSILTVNVTDWDFILTVLVEWPGYCILIVHWWPGIILTVNLVTGTSYPDSLLKWPGYLESFDLNCIFEFVAFELLNLQFNVVKFNFNYFIILFEFCNFRIFPNFILIVFRLVAICCVRGLRIFMIENMSWCWAWTRIPGLVFWI